MAVAADPGTDTVLVVVAVADGFRVAVVEGRETVGVADGLVVLDGVVVAAEVEGVDAPGRAVGWAVLDVLGSSDSLLD